RGYRQENNPSKRLMVSGGWSPRTMWIQKLLPLYPKGFHNRAVLGAHGEVASKRWAISFRPCCPKRRYRNLDRNSRSNIEVEVFAQRKSSSFQVNRVGHRP